MILVGIDSGIKSLAISVIRINNEKEIKLLHVSVHDLLENKTTKKMKLIDNITIARKLKNELQILEEKIEDISNNNEEINVLIEFQLGLNIKSKSIASYCIYHFCDKYNVEIIFPGLKTKYSFKQELDLGTFIKKYSTNYHAQKMCSKNNFLFWIERNKKIGMLKNIKKKNIDDIADAFMMCHAWCIWKKIIN